MTTDTSLDRAAAAALAARIADAVPVTRLEFLELLGLLDVELSRDVPSAAVTVGARSRLILNPDFIDRHCRSDEALLMLVLHELNHIVLGHTRLYPRVTPLHNVAFDALINAQLCRSLPSAVHTALFRGFYRPDVLPGALLRPPVDWRTPTETWQLTGAALELHQALYGGDTVTFTDLVEVLAAPDMGVPGPDPCPLLGNHDDLLPEEGDGGADPAIVKAVRDLVAGLTGAGGGERRGVAGALAAGHVVPVGARRATVAAIRDELVRLADGGEEGEAGWTRSWEDGRTVLPYRTVCDRRAEVRAAWGLAPLLFRGVTRQAGLARGSRVHVYLDVSGSMSHLVPLLYGALRPLREWLHPRIHLFSTEVNDIGHEDLRRGVVLTRWGTDIGCVAEHMLEQGVRRAVVITDGDVGRVPRSAQRELAARRLRCAVLMTDWDQEALGRQLRARVRMLPALR